MISQTSEEPITTVPTSATKTRKHHVKSRKFNAKPFDFLWKHDSRPENALKKEENRKQKENLVEVKILESKTKDAVPGKTSFDFFKNIKKHMHIKKLTIRKSKEKVKEIEATDLQDDSNFYESTDEKHNPIISTEGNDILELTSEENVKNSNTSSGNESLSITEVSQDEYASESLNDTMESYSQNEDKLEPVNSHENHVNETVNNRKSSTNVYQSCSNNEMQQLQLLSIPRNNVLTQQIENIEENAEVNAINDNKEKASITKELLKLSNCGWYWGPISGNEADAKLISEPDGAFLVRDSSDDRYVLTLSFKSSGKLLHTRMEHSGGLFSLCNQSETGGFSSVADLIDYSMNFSQTAVICYSRPKYPGQPSFPVRLTKPVSRFTQVRSLQYLCRFVIRQNTRLDNIHKLPLPKTIKGYIEEAHY